MPAKTSSAAKLLRLGNNKPGSRRLVDFAALAGIPTSLVPPVKVEPGNLDSALAAFDALRDNVSLGLEQELITESQHVAIDERLETIIDFLGRDSARAVVRQNKRLDSVCVALTQAQQVRAAKAGPADDTGRKLRVGWERLDEYFATALGERYRPALQKATKHHGQKLPHWCGIFALWAIKSAGVKCKNWQLGKGIATIFKPTTTPQAGDVAFLKGAGMHMCLVIDVNETELITIDGNTNSAAAATGGQIGRKVRPRSKVRAFFSQSEALPS